MPTAAPEMPRKMLPPPITRHSSTPSACTDFDFRRDARDHRRVEPVLALAHQRLAGKLQQDAAVLQRPERFVDLVSTHRSPPSRRGRQLTSRIRPAHRIRRTIAPASPSPRRARDPTARPGGRNGISVAYRSARSRPLPQRRRGRSLGQPFSVAPTSAAKSDGGFSTPSPSARRTKPATRIGAPASFAAASTTLRYPGLAVDHKDLIEQHRLFVEFAQPPLDHALDDLFGLAAAGRLLAQNGAFAVERRRRHRGDVEILRVGGRDMHRQLPAQRRERLAGRLGFERHQHADLAEARRQRIVHIGGDDAALDREPRRPAQHQVLADARRPVRSAPRRPCGRCRDRRVCFSASTSPLPVTASPATVRTNAWNSSLRATKSVSELTSTSAPAEAARRGADQPLGGDPPGLFRRRRETLLAQPVDRAPRYRRRFRRARACNPSSRRRSCRAIP